MAQIAGEIERGEFAWNLDDEDVHLNIEKRLTALVGDAENACTPAAAATTRSPPTSACGCATRSTRILGLIAEFQARLLEVAETHAGTPCPASPTCRWRSRSPSATT